MEDNKPILYVFHYEDDGSWQFSGKETHLKDEDYRVVSLEEIINIDKSILEISDLPLGSVAFRKNVHSSWVIKKEE